MQARPVFVRPVLAHRRIGFTGAPQMRMDPTLMQFVEFLKANGVAVSILVFAAWFLTFRFWPWYTKDFFPAQLAEQTRQEAEQANLRNAVAALGATVQALPAAIGTAMLANIQSGVTPQLELIASQLRADLDRARESSVSATSLRIDPLAATTAAIRTTLDSEVTASRTRHDELLAKVDSATNHLTLLFLGIKREPFPPGADTTRLDMPKSESLT